MGLQHQLSIMLAGEGRSKAETNYRLMSGSCHLDRVSNVEIGVECQILVIGSLFDWGQVLQFGAHSRYYKGALTQKR